MAKFYSACFSLCFDLNFALLGFTDHAFVLKSCFVRGNKASQKEYWSLGKMRGPFAFEKTRGPF